MNGILLRLAAPLMSFGEHAAFHYRDTLPVLDSLRDHDRTVGVISHVAEMRRRITQRLHVRKSPVGSTLVHITEAAE
ncbi:CRISPR-associated protein Cas5 [Streptomyces chartreusis]|uniref:CRISPR-associated protein Cas5 n=1 Tax=Streptomyces chartreusis TaxID=1969 RepID=UPI00363FF35C